jgi:SAM-dependent methyltransferase
VVPEVHQPAVLEVGCGAGFSATYLAGCYASYRGVDYAPQLIAYAQQHNQGVGVTFEACNIKDYRTDQRFDVIFMIGVLHHIDDLEVTMAHLLKLLQPGGWLVANEPHPGNPLISLARVVRQKIDRQYSSEQQPLTSTDLRRLYGRAGLVDIRIVPQGLLSTPFAEVIIPPQAMMRVFSSLACALDACLTRLVGRLLQPLTWNLIAAGRKP